MLFRAQAPEFCSQIQPQLVFSVVADAWSTLKYLQEDG